MVKHDDLTVRAFANDGKLWQRTFFNAWAKIQQNGYEDGDLAESEETLCSNSDAYCNY